MHRSTVPPSASVVLPCYNDAAFLQSAVERLLQQSGIDLEIIVVDDASTDGSRRIATDLARRHDRVRTVLLDRNRGVAAAREAAVAAATGRYVWFVDADDEWPADALADLVATAEATDAEVVCAGALVIAGSDERSVGNLPPGPVLAGTSAFRALLTGQITGHLWNKLFRRELLGRIEFTRIRQHSDQAMVAQALVEADRVAMLPRSVYTYRPRAGSIIRSGAKRAESLQGLARVVAECARRAGVADSDDYRYYVARYSLLSRYRDAVSGTYPPDEARALARQIRGEMNAADLRAIARRRDVRRLGMYATGWMSPAAFRVAFGPKRIRTATANPDSVAPAPRPVHPTPKREIYLPARGMYENIGDIILRRQLLRWLSPLGRLHVYVGNAPDGYTEALELGPEHIVDRSFTSWYANAMSDAVRGRASYVFKPGEIQITWRGLKEHLSVLPLLVALRLRRGPVLRVGAGARGFERLPRALMRPSVAMSDFVAWRDPRTAAFIGTGEVMPDLAFGEGLAQPRGDELRDTLVVSMRDDRPFPQDAWIDGIREFARRHELEIVCIVQVERDAEKSEKLAERLGGRYHRWSSDHAVHENDLRGLYRRTAIAVSDRLHVLITSFTEGAMPVGLLIDDSDKIGRHFDAIGMPDVAVRTRSMDAPSIEAVLDSAADGWPKAAGHLADARLALERVRGRVRALLAPAGISKPTPTVWHLGRRGEVAGGMTQVVNAYLAWPFERARVRLLVTRNGKRGGLSAYALFLAAFARLPFLGARDRTVIAVHLSQGGSFTREGILLRWASRLGYPTVAHLHGSTFVDYARKQPRKVAKALRAADTVVALSEATVAEVRALVPGVRVELMPNAVPAGSPRDKERIVVFGGGVTRRKGVDVLVEAWRRAAPTDDWELHIAGPLIESELVDDLPEGIERRGALDHASLMALLDRSTIAVLPSRDEAMPMFVLEALARKNAVISTKVGGIPDLLSNGAGLVVSPGDVDELASALRSLIDDSEHRSAIAEAGFKRFDTDFSARAVYPRVEQLWLSVLD